MATSLSNLTIHITKTVRGMGDAVPQGGERYATTILAYLFGNRKLGLAGQFVKKLQDGRFAEFNIDQRNVGQFSDVSSRLSKEPITFLDMHENVRKLKLMIEARHGRNN